MPKSALSTQSIPHIALLRGINVGGNAKVPMADLKKTFEKMGFTNIKTILNTGNVLFDVMREQSERSRPFPPQTLASLTKTIEVQLEKTFGFPIKTLLRTREDIEVLIASQPFKNIKVTPETSLYITFLAEKPKAKSPTFKIPYTSPDKNFQILKLTNQEIMHVLTVTPNMRSTDAMNILEKEFGKNLTTRNWNTVVKMVK